MSFNFNSPSLAAGSNAAAITTYMNGVLGCTCVTVVGAVADHTYNGENHVTGPGTGATSLTLGTSEGATASTATSTLTVNANDNFLATTTDASANVASQITMRFINGFQLTGAISFDYQVFPDGTCTAFNSTACGGALVNGHYPNQPDFEFSAGTNTNGVDPLVTSFGTNGTQWGVTPGTTNGNATASPDPNTTTELAPQYIGTFAGVLANGTTEINFIDWPATIGIDNLTFSYCTSCNTGQASPVPEPTSMVLLGTGIAGAYWRKKKQRAS